MNDDIVISIKTTFIIKKSILTLQQVPLVQAEGILTIMLEGISYHKEFMCLPGQNSLALIDANQEGKPSVTHVLAY